MKAPPAIDVAVYGLMIAVILLLLGVLALCPPEYLDAGAVYQGF